MSTDHHEQPWSVAIARRVPSQMPSLQTLVGLPPSATRGHAVAFAVAAAAAGGLAHAVDYLVFALVCDYASSWWGEANSHC